MRVRHSIAVCTTGRRATLRSTLDAVRNAVDPTNVSDTEVLIVVSGLTEEAGQVRRLVDDVFHRCALPVRLVGEAVSGIARARNLALDEALGDIISFVDDDVHPCGPPWQHAILNTFASQPRVGLLGGPTTCVVPAGLGSDPWWRSVRTDGLLSCGSWPVSGPCDYRRIWTANASYRRTAAGALRFPEDLGWRSRSRLWLAGEDTWFNRQVAGRGWLAWYEPQATVEHHIDRERFTPYWLIQRAMVHGRSHTLFRCADGASLGAAQLRAFCGLLLAMSGAMVAAVRLRPADAFAGCLGMAARLGALTLPHAEVRRLVAALHNSVSESPVSPSVGTGERS